MSEQTSIAFVIDPQPDGSCTCEATLSLEGQENLTRQVRGQSRSHAIALALENLASWFRTAAEAEQDLGWETVERSESGKAIPKRFHVIVHYERVAEDVSKLEAMHNTLLGNTVVENAEFTAIRVDAGLPIPRWKRP
jgi:phosphoribosylformylglycinamidine (FGAM) synthase PurS component